MLLIEETCEVKRGLGILQRSVLETCQFRDPFPQLKGYWPVLTPSGLI